MFTTLRFCSAKSCLDVGDSESIIFYTINCPLHQIYCHSCNSQWPFTVYGHNFIKALQAKVLIDKVQVNIVKHFSKYLIEEHDNIVSPFHKIINTPDETCFRQFLTLFELTVVSYCSTAKLTF